MLSEFIMQNIITFNGDGGVSPSLPPSFTHSIYDKLMIKLKRVPGCLCTAHLRYSQPINLICGSIRRQILAGTGYQLLPNIREEQNTTTLLFVGVENAWTFPLMKMRDFAKIKIKWKFWIRCLWNIMSFKSINIRFANTRCIKWFINLCLLLTFRWLAEYHVWTTHWIDRFTN